MTFVNQESFGRSSNETWARIEKQHRQSRWSGSIIWSWLSAKLPKLTIKKQNHSSSYVFPYFSYVFPYFSYVCIKLRSIHRGWGPPVMWTLVYKPLYIIPINYSCISYIYHKPLLSWVPHPFVADFPQKSPRWRFLENLLMGHRDLASHLDSDRNVVMGGQGSFFF